jgi:hypothetical protein
LTARAQFVEHHGQDDHCALDNQLPVKGDVHQSESIIKDGDDQSSDQRPKDRSDPGENGSTPPTVGCRPGHLWRDWDKTSADSELKIED